MLQCYSPVCRRLKFDSLPQPREVLYARSDNQLIPRPSPAPPESPSPPHVFGAILVLISKPLY